MKPIFFYLFLTIFFLAATQSLAYDKNTGKGKGYHGKSGMVSSMELTDMDKDKNGMVSYDEFKTTFPSTRKNVFGILDKDQDSQLNEDEWQNFKEMHKGMGGSGKSYHGKKYQGKTDSDTKGSAVPRDDY